MIDLNIKGVLYGIAAALPVFRKQGFGHSFSTASTSGHKTEPSQSVYSGTKFAVRAISEGLRQEAGDKAAGDDNFAALSPDELRRRCDKPPGKGPAHRLPQPVRDATGGHRARYRVRERAAADIDVKEITIRPTAQG